MMKKSREQLEQELAQATAKLEQYQHRVQRLENRLKYYQQGERRKRAHRLITRGAAVESVAPAVRGMGERAFFLFVEQVFSLPEVAALVGRIATEQEGGVICSDIFLPAHSPPEYQDRAVLWNAVENVERSKTAQLAYSFDIALQNEFSLEENIALARRFASEQLVSRGMIADFAIHQPDKEEGGIPNPHFHVLCPIRPLNLDGKWGFKQRRVYRLDEDGNRIVGEDGKALFDAVPTTDWGSPETLERWREAWASMVNAKFEEKDLTCRIDHRSYERQGLDIVPTVHEGVAVRQMEAKGIATDKGDLNRWIKKVNGLLRDIRRKIAALTDWIVAAREELSKPQAPSLASLLSNYYNARNAGAWSNKTKVGNLRYFSQAVNFLTENRLFSLEDLEARIAIHDGKLQASKVSMKAKSARKKELEELLRCADLYRELKPIYDELQGVKWKSQREKFRADHESELKQFHMARRKLEKHRTPDGKIPVQTWRQELALLQREYQAEYEQYKPMRDEMAALLRVKDCVDTVLRQQEQTQQKRREVER